MRETKSPFECRSCCIELTRENTGGYCSGRPDICKDCEESAYLRAFAASLAAPVGATFPYPIAKAPWE